MKMVCAAVLMILSCSWAHADYFETRTQEVFDDLKQQTSVMSDDQKRQVMGHLLAISQILDSGASDRASSYGCVSRDNDGASPWVIGFKSGINVTRMNETKFSSLSDCQSALSSGRQTPAGLLLCISRDNDGNQPWQMTFVKGQMVERISQTTMSNFSTCQQTIRRSQYKYILNQLNFCTSRDGDGMNPYVAASIDLASKSLQKGTEMFQSMDACFSFLKN